MSGEAAGLLARDRSAIARKRPYTVVLHPVGARFVNGLASEYDRALPDELEGVVDAADFDKAVSHVNKILTDYWPCPACYWFGVCCCPCTLGASLMAPFYCIREAETYAAHQVRRLNSRACFVDAGVTWQLSRGGCCCVRSSRLKIEVGAVDAVRDDIGRANAVNASEPPAALGAGAESIEHD